MQLTKTILAGTGLVALASGAPADEGSQHYKIGSHTFWKDTQTQSYHCEGQDVIRCETTLEGTCLTANVCEAYCFNYDKGATCIDMGQGIMNTSSSFDAPVSKILVSASDTNIDARDASPEEDKHYVCSKDRTGVLVCRYGFCSTDYYCRSDEECKDDYISCESKSPSAQGSESKARAVANPVRNVPLKLVVRNLVSKRSKSYICSKDRASILKCTYGFCATDYYCAKSHPCVNNPARCKKDLATQK